MLIDEVAMRLLIASFVACVLATPAAAQTVAVQLPEGHEFTNPDRQAFVLSPDGTRIAYLARATLFVKTVNGGDPVLVQGPLQGRGKTNLAFSPDGNKIIGLNLGSNNELRLQVWRAPSWKEIKTAEAQEKKESPTP